MEERISRRLTNQRIRNRIIEVFELFSTLENQEIFGADEIINLWFDFVSKQSRKDFQEPIFSSEELESLDTFDRELEKICQITPLYMPSIKELEKEGYWIELTRSAEKHLTVFNRRGRLDEEKEL